MKKSLFAVVLLAFIAFGLTSCGKKGSGSKAKLETELDSVCYAIGVDIGNNIKRAGIEEINVAALSKGFEDVFQGVDPLIAQEKGTQMIQAYFQKARQAKLDNNLAAANEFLEENKKKEGVVTLPSGLQYQVLTEGSGPVPQLNDKVKVNYVGTLVDGREFDSTTGKAPAEFFVTGVIKGWTEALQLMKVGSKWKLFVPPALAYGENPRPGGIIEPNNALIFEIELLEVIPTPQSNPQNIKPTQVPRR